MSRIRVQDVLDAANKKLNDQGHPGIISRQINAVVEALVDAINKELPNDGYRIVSEPEDDSYG